MAVSFPVLKDDSAARHRDLLVESMRIEVKAGKEREVRLSWRRERVVESRDW